MRIKELSAALAALPEDMEVLVQLDGRAADVLEYRTVGVVGDGRMLRGYGQDALVLRVDEMRLVG